MIVKLDSTRIRNRMAELRMTGAMLSKKTGISRPSISTILVRSTCSVKNLAVIANALSLDISEICIDGK